jgi:hypothetical protein
LWKEGAPGWPGIINAVDKGLLSPGLHHPVHFNWPGIVNAVDLGKLSPTLHHPVHFNWPGIVKLFDKGLLSPGPFNWPGVVKSLDHGKLSPTLHHPQAACGRVAQSTKDSIAVAVHHRAARSPKARSLGAGLLNISLLRSSKIVHDPPLHSRDTECKWGSVGHNRPSPPKEPSRS